MKENLLLKDITHLRHLLNNLSVAIVVGGKSGKIVAANSSAKQLLSKFTTAANQNLKKIISLTYRYKNELTEDTTNTQEYIRFHSHYTKSHRYGPIVTVIIYDVSQERREEKQKKILEYIASVLEADVSLKEWIDILLTKLIYVMSIEGGTVVVHDSGDLKILESTHESFDLKFYKDLIAESISRRIPLATNFSPNIKSTSKHLAYSKKNNVFVAPMFVAEKMLGALVIENKKGELFKEQDRLFYESITNRLAITLEYRNLLERLKQEHERLNIVITNTLHGKVLLDTENRILTTNPAFVGLAEKEIEQLKGQDVREVIPELKKVLENNADQFSTELELNSIEGKPWVGVTATRIKQQDKYQNTVLDIRDITAEKHLDQLKNDFISTATHELRTPLTAIMGYLSMLELRGNLDEKQQLYAGRMQKASENLFELVEDLLAVLRIDQDSVKLKPKWFKLRPIIQEVAHSLETKTTAKQIKISLPKKDHKVYTDANALQRVALNLVDNAIKYSKPGSKITIRFTKSKNKKEVKVSVRDEGLGIPKKQVGKIFEKFHRVNNHMSVEAGGTGLGLYITKKLIEQWGGEINVKSEVGRGSTFSFTIPTRKHKLVTNTQKSAKKK